MTAHLPKTAKEENPAGWGTRWAVGNIGRFLIVFVAASVGVAIYAWRAGLLGNRRVLTYFLEAVPGVALEAGLVYLPPAVPYLLAVFHLPRAWSKLQRRAVVLLLTPILAVPAFPIQTALCGVLCGYTFLYGIAIPLVLGLVVRLPESSLRRRS